MERQAAEAGVYVPHLTLRVTARPLWVEGITVEVQALGVQVPTLPPTGRLTQSKGLCLPQPSFAQTCKTGTMEDVSRSQLTISTQCTSVHCCFRH